MSDDPTRGHDRPEAPPVWATPTPWVPNQPSEADPLPAPEPAQAPGGAVPPYPESLSAWSATGAAPADPVPPGLTQTEPVPAHPPVPAYPPASAYLPVSASGPASAYPPAPAYFPAAPYPGTAWPPAIAARTPRRYGLGVLIAAVLIAAILSCGAGLLTGAAMTTANQSSGTVPRSTSTARTALGTAPTPDSATQAAGEQLLAKILPVPAGEHPITVSGATRGVLDLGQFVAKFWPSDIAAQTKRMQSRAFVVAAQRDWKTSDRIEVHVQVSQYAQVSGAQSFINGQNIAMQADSEVTDTFGVPGTFGAGYEISTLDALGNRRAILVAEVGTVVLFMNFYTPVLFDRDAELALFTQQLARLP